MRILIVSDAWIPQVNGVVRTLSVMMDLLRAGGDVVEVIGPEHFRTLPMPGYAEIRLAVFPGRRLAAMADAFAPDAVHIATEGPLGWSMRALCVTRGWPFTTAFHTKFPEYMQARIGVPPAFSWSMLRRFHNSGRGVFAATASLRSELTRRGFDNILSWSRGVDTTRFRPEPRNPFVGLPRPIFLYAGRIAVEKNVDAFLALDLPGTKVVVGDGPARQGLMRRYPEAVYPGYLENGKLARAFAGADVFVFPSRTDTFGLVLLEALASGTPVAAYPVTGPLDIMQDPRLGALDEDLGRACLRALSGDRAACRAFAESQSWDLCAKQFREGLVPLNWTALSPSQAEYSVVGWLR